jgi:hypothetical protein
LGKNQRMGVHKADRRAGLATAGTVALPARSPEVVLPLFAAEWKKAEELFRENQNIPPAAWG